MRLSFKEQLQQQREADTAELVTLYTEQPRSADELSTITGMPASRINKLLNTAGIKGSKRTSDLKTGMYRLDIPSDEICRLYQEGMTYTQLANDFSISVGTVQRRIRHCGLTPHAHGYRNPAWHAAEVDANDA